MPGRCPTTLRDTAKVPGCSAIMAVWSFTSFRPKRGSFTTWNVCGATRKSLAECYAKTAKELEEMTGRTYSRIHIVGGGSNAGYLNELTAKATKKEIHAGPGEATAIGNITAQMLKAEEFKTIEEARTIIHESFGVKVYK